MAGRRNGLKLPIFKTKEEKMKLFLGIWGRFIGAVLVVSPMAWDILWKGFRSGENIKICFAGVMIQLLGIAFWIIGWYCDRALGGR